ncbi:MAG: ATP-binding protein, partial [Oscillospiraceae bacterium]|nr:ATP-binding protein [Oscillospiraceae bacterium]
EEAKQAFSRTEADLSARFLGLGSKCTALDATARLRILHGFFRPEAEQEMVPDIRDCARKGQDFRDWICPDTAVKHSDYLEIGEKFVRVLYLKDYASFIKDKMVAELTDQNRSMILSIDICPVSTDEAVRDVENRLLGVETNITNWQRRQNRNNNFSAVIPYDMALQRQETQEFLNDLTVRDMRMMFCVLTILLSADSKEQLDRDTEAVLATGRIHMCQIAVLKYQQIDGLQTVLPIGPRRIDALRTLTTESLAVFMPFKVQEIRDRGGIYFGENAISHNLILCNRENLLNQSAFLLGVPGSGKSFSAKELITFLVLNTEDDILICDPEGEYVPLAEAMGEIGSVVRIAAGGRDRLNAMYMVEGYGENDPIVVKSEFILSLIEKIDRGGVGPQHKSVIDRCIAGVYRDARETGTIPTLSTLREKLLVQPEAEAREVALALELYTTGSLDIFGKQSNVDLDRRLIVFDIHSLGEQLKTAGLLVITDTMLNRVTLNWKKGKRTHVFLDEFHVVFENEFSAQFFASAWRQFRKRNAYPTAITQNVDYLLDSPQARSMLSNSEFIVMLNQAETDREKLAQLLNISNEQMSYITNAEPGCGLIRYGSALVPFVNKFPKDTKLYHLMTTRPGEGIFAGKTE